MYNLNLDTRLQSAMCKPLQDNIMQEDGTTVQGEVTPRNILRRIVWQYEVPFYGHHTTQEYRKHLEKIETIMQQINEERPSLDFEHACKLLEMIDGDAHTRSFVKKQLYDIFPEEFFEKLDGFQVEERLKQKGTVTVSDDNDDDSEGETAV